jgi:hypothetical protein
MKTQASNSQESKHLATANDLSKKQDPGESAVQLVDMRPEAIAQRKLQEMADQSPQANKAAQLQAMADKHVLQQKPVQKKKNDTGLPDQLKAGIENLSGYSMDGVKVHYNSDKPAQLQAHAFAQGNDIHLASGQEKHLPHEAWHVVQQKQGRVQATMQLKGDIPVNDDAGLEHEADVMGAEANVHTAKTQQTDLTTTTSTSQLVQRKIIARIRTAKSGNDDIGRIITELRLEGRAPTDSKGSGQGDHTVAETLINESVVREVMNMRPKVALNNLMVLARLTLPEEGVGELYGTFSSHWSEFDTLEGEDQNTILENCIQRYIELANKRPGTAFARSEEVTYGGGKEKQSIGLVRQIADKKSRQEEPDHNDLEITAHALLGLIDMKYIQGEEARYIDIIVRALKHAVFSVLILSPEQSLDLIESLITGLGQRDNFPIQNSIPIYKTVCEALSLTPRLD